MNGLRFLSILLIPLTRAIQNDFPPSYCPYTSSDVVRIVAGNMSQLRLLETLIASYKTIDGSEKLYPKTEVLRGDREQELPKESWTVFSESFDDSEYRANPTSTKETGVIIELAQKLFDKKEDDNALDQLIAEYKPNLIDPRFVDPATKHTPFLRGYPSRRFTLSEYHPLDQIYGYLDALHVEYSRLCQVSNLGLTFEGRPIRILKIGTNPLSTPIIFIDAAMHAREWLSTATALFVASQLVTRYDTDPDIKTLVDSVTWYIVPVINVDGYEFTWTQDRKWRQNRSPPRLCISERCLCRGTDLNRNWDSHWNSTGSCNHPCCETYPGSSAMSELEVQHEARLMETLGPRLQAYISLHTFGQMWAYPYNYQRNTYPPDVQEMRQVALMAANAVEKVNGATYKVGTGADILYTSSGCSTDWAKERLNVKYTYLVELYPPIFDGSHGYGHFCPDASVIVPTAQGIFAGLQVVADAVLGKLETNLGKKESNISTPASASVVSGNASIDYLDYASRDTRPFAEISSLVASSLFLYFAKFA